MSIAPNLYLFFDFFYAALPEVQVLPAFPDASFPTAAVWGVLFLLKDNIEE